MTGTDTRGEVVVACEPGAGRGTWAMGSLFEHLAGPEHTGGTLGVALVTQPPGIATPVHRHHNEAEALYLLDGEMTYLAGEETYELAGGWFMYLPKGVPHAFRIRGERPAHFLALTVPAGLLHLYDEVGVPAIALRIPEEGEGRSMAEEIGRWNEVGPRLRPGSHRTTHPQVGTAHWPATTGRRTDTWAPPSEAGTPRESPR